MKRKAVFLDRDGTIIQEKNYLSDPEGVVLIDGVVEALEMLSRAGFLLIMVTNQSGVARGYFTIQDVEKVNQRIIELLRPWGINMDDVYICPHHENGCVSDYTVKCNCRKPKPGMALMAAAYWGLDLSACYMIGDKLTDIIFGNNLGAKGSFLIQSGQVLEENFTGAIVVQSIQEAAEQIVTNVLEEK